MRKQDGADDCLGKRSAIACEAPAKSELAPLRRWNRRRHLPPHRLPLLHHPPPPPPPRLLLLLLLFLLCLLPIRCSGGEAYSDEFHIQFGVADNDESAAFTEQQVPFRLRHHGACTAAARRHLLLPSLLVVINSMRAAPAEARRSRTKTRGSKRKYCTPQLLSRRCAPHPVKKQFLSDESSNQEERKACAHAPEARLMWPGRCCCS